MREEYAMSTLFKESPERTHCIRCGECCTASSPTLHVEDVPLVVAGHISLTEIFTIRSGEAVWDPLLNRTEQTAQERIKIKETPEGGCRFYDAEKNACRIYENRPLQCRALRCWDEGPFMSVLQRPPARRRHVIPNEDLRRLMEAHEQRCAYKVVEGHVRDIESQGDAAVQRVLELLSFDHSLRQLVPKQLSVDPDALDLILGRPLTETIPMFGLSVHREADGSWMLRPLAEASEMAEARLQKPSEARN